MRMTEEELAELPQKDGFRLRGIEMTRLETFIDAAFAFATTMLVISNGDIPSNYQELILALKKVPALFLSFAVIMGLWLGHRKWSRRYNLENAATLVASLIFIFVLLVYVVPLRLVFSTFLNWVSAGYLPSEFRLANISELVGLFIMYGFGLFATGSLMAFLYYSARKAKSDMLLDQREVLLTSFEMTSWSVQALTGLASAVFAIFSHPTAAVFAGFFYMTFPISMPLISFIYRKKLNTL